VNRAAICIEGQARQARSFAMAPARRPADRGIRRGSIAFFELEYHSQRAHIRG
jgi:hypothetical protein